MSESPRHLQKRLGYFMRRGATQLRSYRAAIAPIGVPSGRVRFPIAQAFRAGVPPPAAPRPRLAAAPTRTDKPAVAMNTIGGRRMKPLSNPFLGGGEVGLDCERPRHGLVDCQAAAGRPGGGEFPRA